MRAPPKPAGFVSLASRLALWTFALVAAVSLIVAFQLTGREHDHYVESKVRAGRMLTELFAAAIVPALDFSDTDALASSLGMLSQNREVVDAVIWGPAGGVPLAELHPGTRRDDASARRPGVQRGEDHIDIAVPAKSPAGKLLGTAWVRVSLVQENAEFQAVRRRIFWLAFALSALIAALLVAVVRRTIISPLEKLERAARRLARGSAVELVDLRRDEVGRLGHAFNHMGRVIREREERIVAVNGRLQALLDNMREAIVVFDGEGHLASERSRFARELFGDVSGPLTDISDLLYPLGRAPEVEREAFRVWLTEAAASPATFDELSELAPKEVRITPENGEDRLFELEFRAVPSEHGEPRIMLLATDVTSRRKLERSVETREREHQKQLTAMRRLLAGGGQVFVRFLASARERLEQSQKTITADASLGADTVEHVFRFVHTLRAEARSFDLGSVEALALAVELELAGTRHAPPDSPLRVRAREKLASAWTKLGGELDAAEALFVQSSPIGRRVLEQVTVSRADVTELFRRYGGRKDELGVLVARLAARPFGELLSALPDNVERWAAKEGKQIELSVSGRETLVPAELSERLGGVLSHLLRNAVAHGIEPPERRRDAGKREAGHIEITCREAASGVVVVVSDDGAGFDEDALRRKSGASPCGRSAVELAFTAGVSTRDEVDEIAGHGVGLGAVRSELGKASYLVSIGSEKGKGVTALIEPSPARMEASHA